MAGYPRYSRAPGTRALRRASFDGRNWTNMGALPPVQGEGEMERAVKDNLATPFNMMGKKKKEEWPGDSLCSRNARSADSPRWTRARWENARSLSPQD